MADLDQLTQALGRNLKRWRRGRGLTLDALATRSGVSRGMIIQIEQARTNPSVGTTVKLADALGVSITTLLDQPQGPEVRIVADDKAVRMWSTPAGSHATLLAGTEAEGSRELWSWTLMPGDFSDSDPHPSGTTEIVHVTNGELTLVLDGKAHRVPAGSSAAYQAVAAHSYRNDGAVPVEMVMAVSLPPVR